MNPKPHLLPPPDLRPVIGFQTLPGIGGAATAATPDGPVPMAWLRASDLVVTRDRGLQPLLDIGRIDGPVPQMGGSTTHWPIRIAAGALGAGVPEADIVMSPD